MNKWKKQSKANTPATIPTEKTSLMEQGHRIPSQDEGWWRRVRHTRNNSTRS